ncbi:MFS transporter [Caballeronia hypogeia]|uniref:MFS transporter n=2 Tax=Caballeronia hypogeia TaxID=1777140 RepID=A0A158CL99_9BURK|nr:MFS transporter [Caballeronia hypogeia]
MLLLVAPVVASQLGHQLGLSASQIGTYFFVELGAFSAAALPSWLWLGKVDGRRVGVIAAVIFIAGNIATASLMPGFAGLLALRAITALGGGTLNVLCMTSAAKSGNRDRVYGLWVIGQLVLGATGTLVFPFLFDRFGLRVMYIASAVLALCATPLISGFASTSTDATATKREKQDTPGANTVVIPAMVVFGVFSFYIAIGGVWTFASKAAVSAGLHAEGTGTVLAFASIMGIAGSSCASMFGGRIARSIMLATGYAILTVALLGLTAQGSLIGFVASVLAFKFAWTFVLPSIMAATADHDRTGRLVASLNLIIGSGLAIGPLLAGRLLDSGMSLEVLFMLAAGISVVSGIVLFRVERSERPLLRSVEVQAS